MQLNNFDNQFNLKMMVNFPARGDVTLDQIMTDIDEYGQAIQLPSLVGNENDHCCIHLQGANITKQYRTVKSDTAALPTRMQPLLTSYNMTGLVLPPVTLLTKWLKNTIVTSLISSMITAR